MLVQARAIWEAGKLWILAGIAVLLFALGVLSGIKWDAGEVEAAKRERDKARTDATDWKEAAEGWSLAAERWKARYAADGEARREMSRQAGIVLEQIAEEKRKAQEERERWQAQNAKARLDPNCAEFLKATKCPAFRSY